MGHFCLLFGFSEQVPESIGLSILGGMHRGKEEEVGDHFIRGERGEFYSVLGWY